MEYDGLAHLLFMTVSSLPQIRDTAQAGDKFFRYMYDIYQNSSSSTIWEEATSEVSIVIYTEQSDRTGCVVLEGVRRRGTR